MIWNKKNFGIFTAHQAVSDVAIAQVQGCRMRHSNEKEVYSTS